ncbi:helix-turn-helix domain-containing protein [Mangrovibacter sp. SLW1]
MFWSATRLKSFPINDFSACDPTIMTTEYRAPALEKGLAILELLAAQDEPLTKKQIAERLNRSVNEIFRMLSVLQEQHYIDYKEDVSGYVLTLKMFTLSNQHPRLPCCSNGQVA